MELTAASELPMSAEAYAGRQSLDIEALVQQFRGRIFRFALASLRDRDAAETVAQDCFLKAYKARAHFRHECSAQTWLMQIAVNLIRDYRRNRKLQFWRKMHRDVPRMDRLTNSISSGAASPEMRTLLGERVKAIWDAADLLSNQQRTVFLLRFVEDMDLLEIAEATGLTEGTVKTHLFRALRAVRNRLGEGV